MSSCILKKGLDDGRLWDKQYSVTIVPNNVGWIGMELVSSFGRPAGWQVFATDFNVTISSDSGIVRAFIIPEVRLTRFDGRFTVDEVSLFAPDAHDSSDLQLIPDAFEDVILDLIEEEVESMIERGELKEESSDD
mgnify:CR=1 FL=1